MEAAQKDTQDMLFDNAVASNTELHWQGSRVKPTATSKSEEEEEKKKRRLQEGELGCSVLSKRSFLSCLRR
ncbi:hypothetical protein MTO96_001251 [Rhipicephalus appendiculatus]